MGLQFAVESYAEVLEDIKPLFVEHYEELALYAGEIPLDPDYGVYESLDKIGALSIYTAREDGVLIGYAIYFVRRHHHYKQSTWAISDIILVRKEHRNAGVATGLFDLVEADMRKHCVTVLHTTTKESHPMLAFFLEARGHTREGASFSMRL